MNTCTSCKWFKPVENDRYMQGGWCNWREPVKLRHLMWGAHNERIKEPDKEWCAEHQVANHGQGTREEKA